jgi:hypothetical protein
LEEQVLAPIPQPGVMHHREEREEGLEERYMHLLQEQLGKLQAGKTAAKRGEKNKRIEMMKTKILEEALLYEDEEDDEEGNLEDVYESEVDEGEEEGESEMEPERIGPDGAIYASSSSGEEMVENEKG